MSKPRISPPPQKEAALMPPIMAEAILPRPMKPKVI
jgi:hypothetical protein